jgi:DNA-binding transcriptional LysR family regulator
MRDTRIEFAWDYRMNLRFVEAFYWVATLKSVSRAAEKLFITQSAMSARLAALEDELGILLIDRRDKQFRLTIPGSRFLGYAEKLLDLQREIKTEMQGGQEPRSLTLRLGVIESVLHSWLISWIEQLRIEQPNLELELTVETTPVLMELVRRGTLDIAFAVLPVAADGVRTKALPPMDMVFVGQKQLHRKRTYTLADIAAHELLTFQRGSQPHVALLDQLRQAQVEPKRVHAISSISAMVQLVQGGFGIATLPAAALVRLSHSADVHSLRCETKLPPLPIHASYRSDPSTATIDDVLRSALSFSQANVKKSKKAE